jgi:mannose-6-phosphate isomerase-like protein (cupin superfamily)
MVFHMKNIEEETIANENFRKVINTSNNLQLVLMSLKAGEDIGMEVHENIDQFFRIEKGQGKAIIKKESGNEELPLTDGSVIVIPKGTYHNIKNTGSESMKLYSIYSPPNHSPNRVDLNKPKEDIHNDYYEKYLKYKLKYLKSK